MAAAKKAAPKRKAAPKQEGPSGVAEPPEGTPGAVDGATNDDELERRRKARAGTSVSERVQNAETDEDEPELFPAGSLEGDAKVTLKNIIKAGLPVEMSASMGTAAVPIKGTGFFDVESEVTLLVRVLPGGPIPVATREKGDERSKVKKWRITQPLTPIFVQEAGSMYSREQVLDLLHEAGVASAVVTRLLGEQPSSAAGA